jgi:hypothetical protein
MNEATINTYRLGLGNVFGEMFLVLARVAIFFVVFLAMLAC